jgi:hypothetical protein
MTLIFSLSSSTTAVVDAVEGTYGSTQDPSSYGNVDEFAPSHIEMDYAISFDESTTFGTVTHTLTVLESVTTVYFDVWDAVEVSMAEFMVVPFGEVPVNVVPLEGAEGSNITVPMDGFVGVEFSITTPNPNIGNALGVSLPVESTVGDTIYIRFTFKTLPTTKQSDPQPATWGAAASTS